MRINLIFFFCYRKFLKKESNINDSSSLKSTQATSSPIPLKVSNLCINHYIHFIYIYYFTNFYNISNNNVLLFKLLIQFNLITIFLFNDLLFVLCVFKFKFI